MWGRRLIWLFLVASSLGCSADRGSMTGRLCFDMVLQQTFLLKFHLGTDNHPADILTRIEGAGPGRETACAHAAAELAYASGFLMAFESSWLHATHREFPKLEPLPLLPQPVVDTYITTLQACQHGQWKAAAQLFRDAHDEVRTRIDARIEWCRGKGLISETGQASSPQRVGTGQ